MRKTLPAWLKRIIIVIFVFVLLVYIGLPSAMGIAAIIPGKSIVEPVVPNTYSSIKIQTADGVTLSAWYLPPQNDVVILVIHGAGGSKAGMLPYANMLAEHGYGVLALDLRGHGESSGKTNRLGWSSTADIVAAVNYLQEQGIRKIGGLGVSLGGEVLLGATAEVPQMKAIVSDGATRRCTSELLALPSKRSLVRNFTARVMYLTVSIFSREKPPAPLLNEMQKNEGTQFYFIAAGNNELETAFNRLFATTIPDRATLWVVPGSDHTQAFSLFPIQYEEAVIEFFDANFFE